jgi:hypothetical protein
MLLRKALRDGLIEDVPLRRKQNYSSVRRSALGFFDGRYQRLRFHYHALAAAIRIVIGRAMTIGRVIAWVNEIESNELLLLSLFQNALAERRIEHARENRDDGKAEHGLGCNAPVRGPTTLRED